MHVSGTMWWVLTPGEYQNCTCIKKNGLISGLFLCGRSTCRI
jgi:hypothetical protein